MSENDDPVFEILCLKSSVHVPLSLENILDKDDDCFREFPEYHRWEIEEIFKSYNDFTNLPEILQKLNFSFPFRPDLIPTVTSLTSEEDPGFRYRSRFILYTFIAWQNNPIMEHAPVVIHSLTDILNLPDYSKCALDAIERCFLISFVKSPLDDFEIIFPLFKGFFTKKEFIPMVMQKQRLIYQYLRALQLSSQEKGLKDKVEIKQYMEFLKKFCKDEVTFFQNETISQIFDMSSNYLCQLELTPLEIFSILSQLAKDSIMKAFAMLFAAPLKTMIESESPFLSLCEQDSTKVYLSASLQSRKKIELPTFSYGIESQFQYIPIETFKSGLDIQTALIIADKPHFKSYFNAENYQKITFISTAYQNHEISAKPLFEWFCETLKEMSNHPDSSYFFDFALMFIAFYRNWRFLNFAKKFWDTIFDTVLFDDRFNAVNEKSMPPLIDKIRMTVISVLSKVDGFSLISQVFESITTRPALMAEMLHRILSVFDKISTNNLNNANLIRIISALLIYYQNINFDKNYESIIPFVETSRSSLFLFISRILQINDCSVVWMENKIFCITFLKFIYEPPIRQFVLTNTKNYLLSLNNEDDDSSTYLNETSVFSVIHDICTFTFDRIPQKQYVIISTEILQIINEYLTHNSQKERKIKFKSIHEFIDMVEPISSAINMLNNENTIICGDFLVQAIHFFASISSEINLGNSHMILIKEATKKIFGKEPSNAIFSKFVQLIAGTQLSSTAPSFIIKQPIALFPLVEIFRESTHILDILQFIYNLIGYSYYNSIIANEYNFDSFLLSIIQSHKCDLKFDQKIIQSLFQIVSLICNTTSSSPVIQKFIDLMCPINGKYLSIYQPLYIQKMQEIISSTMKAPLAFLPLNGEGSTYIELKNVTSSLLGNKFTVSLWLSVDKIASESKLNIFSILDSKSRGIYVMVSTTSLLIKVIYKDLESTARCETPLPMGVWTPILIRIEFLSGKVAISPSVDRSICRKLEFNYDGFRDDSLQIRIGYTPDQKQDEVSHVYLSSFQIYNKIFPNDEIPRFYDVGPRQMNNDFKDVLFTLQLANNKGDIGIGKNTLNSAPESGIKAHLIGKSVRCHPSFCSVLISGDKADLFMPLFSFFDMPTIEEKYLLQVPDLTIDLIMTTLSISEDVEKAFENKSGFQIISHLLNETKIFKPTYSTYNRLFMLLPTLTYENLKISLMKYILVNFSLLAKFDRVNQERIIKHWSRVLVYENQNLLAKVWNVTKLLCAIEKFIESKKQQKENLYDIQTNLFKLLTMIASIQLTKDDLDALICFSLKCSEDQSIHILRLLSEIVRSESQTIEIIKENWSKFYQLHSIVKQRSPELFLMIIDLIYELHNQNIITEINIQQHLDILMQNIQYQITEEDILFGLIERINKGKHELLPITCFIAMNLEDDYLSTLFSDVQPHNLTLIPRFWVITVASIAPPDIRTKIINFVIECQKTTELNDIFYTVEIVSSVLCDDHLPHELILILAQDLVHRLKKLEKSSNEINENQRNAENNLLNTQIDLLFQFASSAIFFQRTNLRILEEEFRHSSFFINLYTNNNNNNNRNTSKNSYSKSQLVPKPRHFSSILDDTNIDNFCCDDSEDSDFSVSSVESISDSTEISSSSNKYKSKERALRSAMKSSSVASHLHKMNVKKSRFGGSSLSSALYLDNSAYPIADVSDSEINNFKTKKNKSRKSHSSSFSIKRYSSDSDTILEIEDGIKLKYSPTWIYEEMSKYEKGKVFSIRTDKSGRWLDCDIAEWCMKLFDRRRGNLFLNFALLLIAFMLKYHPNIIDIESHLKKMQLKPSQIKAHDSFLCLIKRNCKRFKRRIRDISFIQQQQTEEINKNDDILNDEKRMEEKKNDYKAFCCYSQFVDASKNQVIDSNILKMLKSFMKTQDFINQFYKDIDLLSDEKVEAIFTNAMKNYKQNEEFSRETFAKLWNHSWRAMTFELAPWESAVVSNTRAIYERSLLLSHSLIPVRMKRKIQNDLICNKDEINDKTSISNKDQWKEYDCILISPKQRINGKFCISFEIKKIQLITTQRIKIFNTDEIRFVIPISRNKKSSNIFELILHNGKSFLINLLSQKLHPLLKDILDISIKNENSKLFTSSFRPKLDIITDKWIDKKISTFEYITKLNIFAGRTFNDINHYPIFPWVLKTYCSKVESTDLFNQNIYRDFSEMTNIEKSMTSPAGAKIRTRAKSSVSQKPSLTSSFKMWNSENQESDSGLSLSSDIESSLSSDKSKQHSHKESDSTNESQNNEINNNNNNNVHEISKQIPTHLIPSAPQQKIQRIPNLINENEKIKFKPNSVKLPSFSQPAQNYLEYISTLLCRVPYSTTSFVQVLKFRSISDFFDENGFFHEIIPEFFSLPECLCETDSFPAVELPLWANSPIDFVYKHRKLLESDFISSKIHNWFDIIFGVERNDANKNTSSLVSSTSYSTTNSEEEDENEDENILWPQPKQLFTTKHLKRKVPAFLSPQTLLSDYDIEADEYYDNIPLKQSTNSMKISPSKDQKESSQLNPSSTSMTNNAFISSSNSYHSIKNVRTSNMLMKMRNQITFKISLKDTEFVFALIDTSQIISRSSLSILMITSNGLIKQMEIDFTDVNKKRNETLINPKIVTLPDIKVEKSRIPPKRDVMNTIVPLNEGFAMTNGQESLFLIYEKNVAQKTIRAPFGNIKALCSSGDYFATIGTDMTTRFFKSDQVDQPIYSISTYQGDTTCAAISKNFGIFVSGSIDGAIHIGSLSNGNVQKVVNIVNKPIHIIVSEGWGFIVVFSKVMPSSSNASFFSSRPSNLLETPSNSSLNSSSSIDLLSSSQNLKLSSSQISNSKSSKRIGSGVGNYELLLYTVNGIFVNSVSIGEEIVAWETWVDRKGFDFLAIALKSGKIHMFELYYMKLGHPILRKDLEIIGIKYDKHTDSLIMVSSTGEINIKSVHHHR